MDHESRQLAICTSPTFGIRPSSCCTSPLIVTASSPSRPSKSLTFRTSGAALKDLVLADPFDQLFGDVRLIDISPTTSLRADPPALTRPA